MSAEARLSELGIILPPPVPGGANRVAVARTGNLLYTSGHGPAPRADGTIMSGKVGTDLTLEEGREAARLAGLARVHEEPRLVPPRRRMLRN